MSDNERFTLRSDSCRVTLHPSLPLVYEYGVGEPPAVLFGSPTETEPDIEIFRQSDRSYSWTSEGAWEVRYDAAQDGLDVSYAVSVAEVGVQVVSFDVRFHLEGNQLTVSFGSVRESPGYELMRFRMPVLLSVKADQPNSNLAISTYAGRRIPVAQCPPHERIHLTHWTEPAPLGIVYHDHLTGLLHASSADDHLISAVREDEAGNRFGALSVEFTHRLKANPPAPQFVVQESSLCSILLLGDENGDGKCDWTDGAVYWHGHIEGFVHPLYESAYVYKIFQDIPNMEDPTTFDEALDLIRRVHRLTDGAPQIVYLVGWQHRGHDIGYPDVFTVNERLGGIERLKRLMSEARRYNAIVSFHDNYDDAYLDSPGFDPDDIARDEDGDLMKGWVWAGGQSYIIGAAWYAEHGAAERIRRTLDMYPIESTYHIDVVSAETGRFDFRPENPAGAAKNLEGKRKIIGMFNERGVDVTSEGMGEQLIGCIHHAYTLQRPRDPVFPVEARIPLAGFLFHGKATYAGAQEDRVIDSLHYGSTFMTDYKKQVSDEELADRYYLIVLPAFLVQKRPMWRYEENGDRRTVWYSEDTFVEVDESGRRYRMVVDGRLVSQDHSSFVLAGPDEALAYSRDDREIRYPVPDGWTDAGLISAHDLLEGAPADLRPSIADGELLLTVRGGHPYRVQYSPAV